MTTRQTLNAIIRLLALKSVILFLLLINIVADNKSIDPGAYNYYDRIWERILHTESDGMHFRTNGQVVISEAGAIGVAQVMPATLRHYNWTHGTDYPISVLYDEGTNRMIGRWKFDLDLRVLRLNVLDAVNSYQMGLRNTRRRRRYNAWYLYKVMPDCWWAFFNSNRHRFVGEGRGKWRLKR